MSDAATELLLEKNPALGFLLNWIDAKEYRKEHTPLGFYLEKELEGIFLYGVEIFHQIDKLSDWLKDTKHLLVLLEEDHQKIKFFLENEETAKCLQYENVLIFSPIQSGKIEEALLVCMQECPIVNFLFFFSSAKSDGASIQQKLIHLLLLKRGEIAENLCLESIFSNIYNNLPRLPYAKSIYHMKQACKNIPAVVCGAGPSLKNHLEQLKSIQDQAFIFAGGSTIAALNYNGIFPHLQVATDPTQKEYTIIKGAYSFEKPLLLELRSRFDVANTTNGSLAFAINSYDQLFLKWLVEKFQMKEVFQDEMQSIGGSSVTMLCIDFAVWLGCSPIFLVGIDLAYKENKKYLDGAPVDLFMEGKESKQIVVDSGIIKHKNKSGEEILTQNRWVMEAEEIEDKASKYNHIKWINLNAEGLGFKNIQYQPFEEIQKRYLSQTYDLDGILHLLFQQAKPCTCESLQKEINPIRESLYKLKMIYGDALENNYSDERMEYYLNEEIAYTLFLSPLEKILKNKRVFDYPSKKIYTLLLEKTEKLIAIMES